MLAAPTTTAPQVTAADAALHLVLPSSADPDIVAWQIDVAPGSAGQTCDALLAAPPSTTPSPKVLGLNDTYHTLSGLTNGVPYVVTLSALDAFGNTGAASPAACAVPAAAAPVAPNPPPPPGGSSSGCAVAPGATGSADWAVAMLGVAVASRLRRRRASAR
jgi:MYXO-CTERM domain-containing protein